MCDHCARATSDKNYAGQVTCRCDHGEKKDPPKDTKKTMTPEESDDKGLSCGRKKTQENCCKTGCDMKRSSRDERSRKN